MLSPGDRIFFEGDKTWVKVVHLAHGYYYCLVDTGPCEGDYCWVPAHLVKINEVDGEEPDPAESWKFDL